MKCVITGALGHIGSALIRKLPDLFDDLSIVMIDDLSTQRYASLFNLPTTASYEFIEGKVQSVDWSTILKGADVVIHLAATTDASGTAEKPEAMYANNFSGTQAVAQACLLFGVPLIFPSTTSLYGSQEATVDERCAELSSQSPYADCKIKEEMLLQEMFEHDGLKVAICRLGTIYGVSQGMRFHTAVNRFCWQAVVKQPLTIWETALDQKRPYLSLEDAVYAFAWIIKNNLFNGETYNIVTGNHTVRQVVSMIEGCNGACEISLVKHVIMNQLSYEVLSDKFKATGFSFSGSLEKGIGDTVQLIKNASKRDVI